ncbi:MAG: glycosyltransferase family 4 protein [Dictyoglomus sp.]|nr:glycosyltransferase family 4 protein [Dictyoglomus sp.]MDW8189235.1 glycosyltransferase family 4 protein [Dictyoglomus sp.]
MKIALVHDWLINIGGAEKVLESILEIFPDAHLFTLIYSKATLEKLSQKPKKVFTSFLQSFPKIEKLYPKLLFLMPYAIEQFDLSQYDLIISSSHCVAKGVLTKSYQKHICYCHTPLRYAWDLYFPYLKDHGYYYGLKGFLAKGFLHYIRVWDVISANRVDYFIANSENVARRIWKIYRREAKVIYPPVDLSKFKPIDINKKKDFFVTVSRLVPYKKVDLIVKTFNNLKLPLVVIGSGSEEKKLRKIAEKNIEILGWQPDHQVYKYLAEAQGFIFSAEEDFGIVPVEAQACGTPVIAYKRGGAVESVIEGKTGIFFEEQTEESLKNAILRFLKIKERFNTEEIVNNAKRFSKERFKEEFLNFISQIM